MTLITDTLRVPPVGVGRPAEFHAAQQTLSTGLRVLAAVRGGAPIVELRLLVPFGGVDPMHPATAELLAVTLLGGTDRYDRGALDTELARIGANLNVTVRPEYLLVSGHVLADGAARLLHLLADVLTGATYLDADVAAERRRLTYRLRTHAAQPQIVARAALLRRCIGDHPAAREVPSEPDLARVDAAAVRRLHHSHLVPGGAALTLVGDLDPARAIELATTALSGWTGAHPATRLSTPPPPIPGQLELLDNPGGQQVMVGLAGAAPIENAPDYPAAYLANLVFGGYFASRLFEQLRETRGYVYTCRSTITQRAGSAMVMVEFATDPTRAADALQETNAELCRIARTDPADANEIDAARGYAIGSQAVALATQGGAADSLAVLALRGQPLSWPSRWLDMLVEVSDSAVRESAARLFDPDLLTGFVYGPASVLVGAPSALGGRVTAAASDAQSHTHETNAEEIHHA